MGAPPTPWLWLPTEVLLSNGCRLAPRGISVLGAIGCAFWLLAAGAATAGPQNGAPSDPATQITQPNATTTLISDFSDKTTIVWDSFDVAPSERVEFQFQAASDRVINFDLGADATDPRSVIGGDILGTVGALPGGHIFLLNPNGIVIDGTVNAGAFYAIAGGTSAFDPDLASQDIGLGGDVALTGSIQTLGSTWLLGQHVRNLGTLDAGGQIVLVAGSRVQLLNPATGIAIGNLEGGGLASTAGPGIVNTGQMTSGGDISFTASDVFALGVNTTGWIDAGGDLAIASRTDTGATGQATIEAGGSLAAGGDLTLDGPVVLVADTTLSSGSATRLTSSVDSDASARSLDVTSASGAIELPGAVGSGSRLAAVDLASGTTLLVGDLATTGSQRLAAAAGIELAGGLLESTTSSIDLLDAVTVSGNTTVSAGTDVTFAASVDSGPVARDLNVAASRDIQFVGAVGALNPLGSLSANAGSALALSNLHAIGDVDLAGSGGILLSGSLIESTGGSIRIRDALALTGDTLLSAGDDLEIDSTLDGAGTLVMTAGDAIALGGAIGGTTPFASIDANAGTTLRMGNVTSVGDQVWTAPGGVALAGGRLESTAGQVRFPSAVEVAGPSQIHAASDVQFLAGIDGVGAAADLSVDSGLAISIAGPIGAATRLRSLALRAGTTLDVGNVETTGDLSLSAATAISLVGAVYDASNGSIVVDRPLTLTRDTRFTAGQDLTFAGSIDSDGTPRTLDARAGRDLSSAFSLGAINPLSDVSLVAGRRAIVSDVHALGSLVASGAVLDLVGGLYESANGDISFDGATTLGADTLLRAGRDVTVTGRLDSDGTARALDVDAGRDADVTALTGDVAALSQVSILAGGTIRTAGTRTTGDQLFTANRLVIRGVGESIGGSLLLDGNVELSGGTSLIAAGDVLVTGAIDSAGNAANLAVDATGDATLSGDLGATRALRNVDIRADARTTVQSIVATGGLVVAGTRGLSLGGSLYQSGGSLALLTSPDAVGLGEGIEFTNTDVLVTAGKEIRLGSDLSAVPEVASVFLDGGTNPNTRLRFRAGENFTTGANQKVTVIGASLEILASGTAAVGDLSAVDHVRVQGRQLEFNLREPGGVTLPGGGTFTEDPNRRVPDVVANAVTLISSQPIGSEAFEVTVGTATGDVMGTIGGQPSDQVVGRILRLDQPITASSLRLSSLVPGAPAVVLDSIALGQIVSDRAPIQSSGSLGALGALLSGPLDAPAPPAKSPKARQVLAALKCTNLGPGNIPPDCIEVPVVSASNEESLVAQSEPEAPEEADFDIEADAFVEAQAAYRELLRTDRAALQSSMADAIVGLRAGDEGTSDPRELRSYVDERDEHHVAREFLADSEMMFAKLESVELDDVEYQEMRLTLLDELKGIAGLGGYSVQQMGQLVRR
jgi:filamentous hemagglutinin family protein